MPCQPWLLYPVRLDFLLGWSDESVSKPRKKWGGNLGELMTWYQLCWCHGVVGCEHSRVKVPRDGLSQRGGGNETSHQIANGRGAE
jgi:hypothetical protein